MLALSIGSANAKSDKESCSTTSTDVKNLNSDGTEAECAAFVGPPNKATAKASDMGSAESEADDGSTAVSDSSGVNSEATAQGVDGGDAKATASGMGAMAT